MISVSAGFKQQLYNNRRNYINRVDFRLADGTKFSVDNTQIWSGGLSIDDAISDDNSFSVIGATVINSCTITLYNNKDQFSDYTFKDGKATVYTGLKLADNTIEPIKKGVFIVDSTKYNDTTITLNLLDNMTKFDRPYSESKLTYPATLEEIVRNCCAICGVTLSTNSYHFPHYNFSIASAPTKEDVTFREIISWCATIAGCYARCDRNGELEFGWFDTATLEELTDYDGGTFDPWTESEVVTSSGMGVVTDSAIYYGNNFLTVTNSGNRSNAEITYSDDLNGGYFNPWTEGTTIDAGSFSDVYGIQYLNALWSQNLAVDDIVITGVQATVKLASTGSDGKDTKTYLVGTTDYCIDIAQIDFITESNVNTILNWLAVQLIGLRFRSGTITQLNNPAIEAGDIALVWDTKGKKHPFLVTRVTFSPTDIQTVVCGASSPLEQSSTRFSQSTRSYTELRQKVNQKITEYDLALQQLSEELETAGGLYQTTVEQPDGSSIIILHNKREIENSDIQIKITTVGITVTANGTDEEPTWFGLKVDGTLIASILYTIGVNADWINTGKIRSQDGSVYINLDNGDINIKGVTTFNGFATKTGLATSGYTTINGDNITTGTIKDPNSNTVFNLSTGALNITKGSINIGNNKFIVDSSGNLTATAASLRGTLRAGSTDGDYIYLTSAGKIAGGNGSTQYGYIDYSATVTNVSSGTTYRGIKIDAGCLRITVDEFAIGESQSASTAITGYTGNMNVITSITDNGNGTISWHTKTIRFIHGIMVSQIS